MISYLVSVSHVIPCSSMHYFAEPSVKGEASILTHWSLNVIVSVCKSSYNWTNICTLERILLLIQKILRYLVTAVVTSSSLFCTKTQKSWFRTTGRKFIITWIFSILSKFCNGCKKENAVKSNTSNESCLLAFLLWQVKCSAATDVIAVGKQDK